LARPRWPHARHPQPAGLPRWCFHPSRKGMRKGRHGSWRSFLQAMPSSNCHRNLAEICFRLSHHRHVEEDGGLPIW
jgi:hypothetical protein